MKTHWTRSHDIGQQKIFSIRRSITCLCKPVPVIHKTYYTTSSLDLQAQHKSGLTCHGSALQRDEDITLSEMPKTYQNNTQLMDVGDFVTSVLSHMVWILSPEDDAASPRVTTYITMKPKARRRISLQNISNSCGGLL